MVLCRYVGFGRSPDRYATRLRVRRARRRQLAPCDVRWRYLRALPRTQAHVRVYTIITRKPAKKYRSSVTRRSAMHGPCVCNPLDVVAAVVRGVTRDSAPISDDRRRLLRGTSRTDIVFPSEPFVTVDDNKLCSRPCRALRHSTENHVDDDGRDRRTKRLNSTNIRRSWLPRFVSFTCAVPASSATDVGTCTIGRPSEWIGMVSTRV